MAAKSFRKNPVIAFLIRNSHLLLLLVGIGAGVGLGFGLRAASINESPRKTMYVGFIGELFLNLLKIVILPLIVSSLITGLSTMESSTSGQIGSRAVAFYLVTTLFAVFLGIGLVVGIQPGSYRTQQIAEEDRPDVIPSTTADAFLDLFRKMFPQNIVEACISQYQTVLKPPKLKPGNTSFPNISLTDTTTANSTPISLNSTPNYEDWLISSQMVPGINILGVVVFTIIVGMAISVAGEKGKPLASFFDSLNEVVMIVVKWIMTFAPVGVCFLVAHQILLMEDFTEMISQLGMYFMTVCVGLLIHSVVVLPICYVVLTTKNPIPFMVGSARALVTGFATGSSTATLPVTFECCEQNIGIDPRITRFVIPIGATINMHGTALYEAIAALFIAQLNDIELDFGKIMAVSITATFAAIGAAGIPQAGLVTLVMVLDAVGLPPNKVATILTIDWLLDRFRTAVNIFGDIVGAAVVDHQCKGFLKKLDAADNSKGPINEEESMELKVDITQTKQSNGHIEENSRI